MLGEGLLSAEWLDGTRCLVNIWRYPYDSPTIRAVLQSATNGVPGDLNGDGFVGGADLDIIRAFWGQDVVPGSPLNGDPSGDGFVGGADLDEVRAHWGEGTPPDAVPEPSTLILCLLGILAVGWRRRHRVVLLTLLLASMSTTARGDFTLWGDEELVVDTVHQQGILYDRSHVDVVTGGDVTNLDSYDSSTVDISGGSAVTHLRSHGQSTVNIMGGGARMTAYDSSKVFVSAGWTNFISTTTKS